MADKNLKIEELRQLSDDQLADTLLTLKKEQVDAALTSDDKAAIAQRNQQIAELKQRIQTHGWIQAIYDVGPPPPPVELRLPKLVVPPVPPVPAPCTKLMSL